MAQRKKGKHKLWIALLTVIILGGGSFFYIFSKNATENDTTDPYVIAERGTVVEKALATGTIEPFNEIEVKSKISGVVSHIYAEPGDYVRKGEPLIEVSPDPTPLELAEAKRNLERTLVEEENLSKEFLQVMNTFNQ
jgi:HlyD family secretion protein